MGHRSAISWEILSRFSARRVAWFPAVLAASSRLGLQCLEVGGWRPGTAGPLHSTELYDMVVTVTTGHLVPQVSGSDE